MKKKNALFRMLSVFLASLMLFSLAACKDNQEQEEDDQQISDSTYVYVPQFRSLNQEEDSYMGSFQVMSNRMYFEKTVYSENEREFSYQYLDLSNPDGEPVTVYQEDDSEQEEGFSSSINTIFPDGADGIVLVTRKQPVLDWETATDADYQRVQRQTVYNMKHIAGDGSETFNVDITEYVQMDADNSYIQHAIADAEGRIYISNGSSYIWVFDKEGSHESTIQLTSNPAFGGYVNSMGVLGDGRAAFMTDGPEGMYIAAYNADKKDFSDTYGNLPPQSWNSALTPGFEGGVLISSQDALYEYDLETQTYKEILKWMDCDMHPDYVRYAAAMPDGSIIAYYEEWGGTSDGTSEQSIVQMKKTPASEVVQKKIITLGCMSMSQGLQSAVISFNKNNPEYKIEVKDYTASLDWSSEDYAKSFEDARNRFYNDILTGNAPDLFVESDINLKQFATMGVIEDLTPYLENSSVVKKSDLFEKVLDAYTINGILCTIPDSFTISTLIGRTSELGEEPGWTMEEMIAYADEYPEAVIFPYASRDAVLTYCLMFNFDSYVNWETGECTFDSPEFKLLLEFAARYGEEADYNISQPKVLANHEALLCTMSFSDVQDWQLMEMMFNEPITAIGFPATDSTGIMADGRNGFCISATSQNKEAAWAFIESLLTEEAQKNTMFKWGFPIRKSTYDEILEEAMTPDYQLNPDGTPVLDEDGNPIEVSHHSYEYDDVTFELMAVTQEEADRIAELFDRIGGTVTYNEQLMSIINEEVEPYFAGQKSVEEVTDAIQGRIKLYVDENR